MADLPDALKSLTVKALRDLARKHVGEGYSRLKTKSQLVSAIAKSLDGTAARALVAKITGKKPEPAKAAAKAPAKSATPTKAPTRTTAATRGPLTPALSPGRGEGEKLPSLRARAEGEKASSLAARAGGEKASSLAARAGGEKLPSPPAGERPGEGALRPQVVPYDERLGELPDRYQDDAFVALAVDPETLFLYWDHAPQTVRNAAAGLSSPRAVLSLHAEGQRVREIDFALESRCFYVRGLPPGKAYHAEIDFVGSDGRRKRVGHPSNSIGLPPSGPSTIVDDRFVAFPWALEHGWHLQGRPAPGTAQRDLAGGGARGGASMPPRPWSPGGSLSGRPLGK